MDFLFFHSVSFSMFSFFVVIYRISLLEQRHFRRFVVWFFETTLILQLYAVEDSAASTSDFV